MKENKKTAISVWLVIGVIVLVILLILWLTIADLWGDTDVAAYNNLIQNSNELLKLTLA